MFALWIPSGRAAPAAPPPAPPWISAVAPVAYPAPDRHSPATTALDTLDPLPSATVSVWKEAADDLDQVTLDVSPGYDIVISGPQVEGTGAFHLAHPDFKSQTILLNPVFAVESWSRLFFESRLGYATEDQEARVEVSIDGGAWNGLWSRAGTTGDSGQGAFERVEIDLFVFAGQTVRLRFRYLVSGSYYNSTAPNFGWLIDDIQVGPEYVIVPQLYAIGDPTGLEQQILEMINRARADAPAEAIRLRDTDDADVQNAMSYYEVDPVLLVEQFDELAPVLPPLAMNARLLTAARLHSQDMLDNAFQGHVSSDNPPEPNQPGDTQVQRLQRQGYVYADAAENVFAYAQSAWHAHAGFNIDWGEGAEGSIGGMQNPPGHRWNIHDAKYREVGIGLFEGSNPPVGPMLVTQNFATEQGRDQPFITGVAWRDLNGNDFYDPGEGLSDMTVIVEGQRFMATTPDSGGYAVPVSGNGTYTVHFRTHGLTVWTTTITVKDDENLKLDFRLDQKPPFIFSIARDPGEPAGLQIIARIPAGTPVLIHSPDLQQWNDLAPVPIEDLGNGMFRFEPQLNLPANFFRVRGDP